VTEQAQDQDEAGLVNTNIVNVSQTMKFYRAGVTLPYVVPSQSIQ
jgi:hypothetical protein